VLPFDLVMVVIPPNQVIPACLNAGRMCYARPGRADAPGRKIISRQVHPKELAMRIIIGRISEAFVARGCRWVMKRKNDRT
jgi:hypothetical protein